MRQGKQCRSSRSPPAIRGFNAWRWGAVCHRRGVPREFLQRPTFHRYVVVGLPNARSTAGHAGW
eukprot:291753-Pyramimonas_sp.AAC.2